MVSSATKMSRKADINLGTIVSPSLLWALANNPLGDGTNVTAIKGAGIATPVKVADA